MGLFFFFFFFPRADQIAMGGSGFAEVLCDWCFMNACGYGGKVGEVRLLYCVGWARQGWKGHWEGVLEDVREFSGKRAQLGGSSETRTLSWRSLKGRGSSTRT